MSKGLSGAVGSDEMSQKLRSMHAENNFFFVYDVSIFFKLSENGSQVRFMLKWG